MKTTRAKNRFSVQQIFSQQTMLVYKNTEITVESYLLS